MLFFTPTWAPKKKERKKLREKKKERTNEKKKKRKKMCQFEKDLFVLADGSKPQDSISMKVQRVGRSEKGSISACLPARQP